MDQAAPAPAAQVPSTAGTSTAEQGHAQLRQLIRSVREMVALRVSPVPAPDSATAGSGDAVHASTPSHQQQMEALQRQYETCKEALRATFRQLDEAAVVAAASSSAAQEAHAAMDIEGTSGAQAQLQRRHAELVLQLEGRNETIKELMDASRQLLDAMCMWQSHKKQLDLQQQALLR